MLHSGVLTLFSPTECDEVPDCSVCDTDPKICDICSEEGAKFDTEQSKCIVGDDSGGDDDDGGGPNVGAIIGESTIN